jgi:hypothetical protein
MAGEPRCRYCTDRHSTRFLCNPAKKVLDAMVAKGMSFNMPTLEFPEPIAMPRPDLPDVDVLAAQIVVMGAVVEVAGVARPALVFTGQGVHEGPLPRWMYAGEDDDLTRLSTLVSDMTALAIKTAARARGE